jgi:o-succinylbenzoate synthase
MVLTDAIVASVGGETPTGDLATVGAPARREGLVLTLLAGRRACGLGEASPLPGYSPDTLADARTELLAWRPPPEDTAAAPAAVLARATADLRAPSARFAVEAALLDWLGRRAAVPVHRLLGAPRTPHTVFLAHLVPLADADAAAVRLRARGVRHLKFKVGRGDAGAEIAALRAVRTAVPDAVIRLDANGRFPAPDVPALCRAYAAAGIELIEEPCPPEALLTLPRLAIGVGLDESLGRPDAAALASAVARAQPLAALILKPTCLGGFTPCLALAALGRRLGCDPIVTHAFDGPVAMAAAAELALALPDARLAGLAPHPCLAAYPRRRAAAFEAQHLTTHDAPGLGLTEAA